MNAAPVRLWRALTRRINNLPFLRPAIERNRWLVAAYFNHRYRKTDPYAYQTDTSERIKRERITAFLSDRRYDHILEVGCGEGHMTGALLPLGRTLTGIDISRRAIRRARDRHRHQPHLEFIVGDVLAFRSSRRFDLITCSETLYYLNLAQIEQAVRILSDHLAPGGRLLSVNIFASTESSQGLELKATGAGTIHPLLQKASGLRVVRTQTYPEYEMMLFQRRPGPDDESPDRAPLRNTPRTFSSP
jgi:SAM-dependent methyltransferase